jgi:hypothetical protein
MCYGERDLTAKRLLDPKSPIMEIVSVGCPITADMVLLLQKEPNTKWTYRFDDARGVDQRTLKKNPS